MDTEIPPAYVRSREIYDNIAYSPDTDEPKKNGLVNGKTSPEDVTIALPRKKMGDEEGEEEEEEEDPWNVEVLQQDYVPWDDLTENERIKRAVMYPIKIVLVLGFLYLFICSLDFLSSAFKLLGGKKAGEVFQQNEILTNPVAGVMMGVLVTVLVQSSSTSTSIVISMVGAGILNVRTAVPIVMGANIGTSVTNTIVALGQITNKADFRRAFAGATVHDMFNWLTVIVLLPLEVITGYLFRLSDAIVKSLHLEESLKQQDLLKVITKPFTTLIINVSSSGIKNIAKGTAKAEETSLMKTCCDKTKPADCCEEELDKSDLYQGVHNYTMDERVDVCKAVAPCVLKKYGDSDEGLANCTSVAWNYEPVETVHKGVNTLNCTLISANQTEVACCNSRLTELFTEVGFDLNVTAAQQKDLCSGGCFADSLVNNCSGSWAVGTRVEVNNGDVFHCETWAKKVERSCNKPCEYLFLSAHEKGGGPLSDEGVGAILLVVALLLLCICLIAIVKLLHSLLRGPMARVIKKFINADFPGCCAGVTGYLAILLGAGITILVQSSSIFTSTLTPLVGIGVINLDRMYPLTLGSNIGTTFTGILSALAQDVDAIPRSLQVAFCHLFFNISGILIFYPFPFFRPPIPAAKFLGNVTAKYRWFAAVYLICMFFLMPAAVFGLSIPGWYVLAAVLIPIGLLCIIVGVIKFAQNKCRSRLPAKLQDFKALPKPLRSLEPYDRGMRKVFFCCKLGSKEVAAKSRAKGGVANGSTTTHL